MAGVFGWWMRRRTGLQQRLLPYQERAERRQRHLKQAAVTLGLLGAAMMLGGTNPGRYGIKVLAERTRLAADSLIGITPEHADIERLVRTHRARAVERARQSLANYHRTAPPEIRRLFHASAMDPEHGLVVAGRASDAFVLSARVFEADRGGRSYRLRPGVRSVWLRQITIRGGPLSHLLVPDTPDVRAAAMAAGGVVEEPSAQVTNSWGLRGPEPDPDAPVRGMVLGDSFMQGMFIGDDATPPVQLQKALARLWGVSTSIVNTGHIGYAPEQYYGALREYGERFRPQFVVVSVCPNDFGDGGDVLAGRGDDWGEADYWLGEVVRWCRSHQTEVVLAPVPQQDQIVGLRKNGRYPGPVSDLFQGGSTRYLDALDPFIDEHLRLRREGQAYTDGSPLYNRQIGDGHFSPSGAELWAQLIARRLSLLFPATGPGLSPEGRPGKMARDARTRTSTRTDRRAGAPL